MTKKIGKALVVGAGISGIRAALDLAEFGYGVTLIDRSPHIWAAFSASLIISFPPIVAVCVKMLPLVDRDAGSQYCLRKGLFHENIEILLVHRTDFRRGRTRQLSGDHSSRNPTGWIRTGVSGAARASDVCPVEVPDDFNAGLTQRKAIYLPVPHAIPNPYHN